MSDKNWGTSGVKDHHCGYEVNASGHIVKTQRGVHHRGMVITDQTHLDIPSVHSYLAHHPVNFTWSFSPGCFLSLLLVLLDCTIFSILWRSRPAIGVCKYYSVAPAHPCGIVLSLGAKWWCCEGRADQKTLCKPDCWTEWSGIELYMGFTSQNVPVRELEKNWKMNSSSKTYGRLKSMIRFYRKFVFFSFSSKRLIVKQLIIMQRYVSC